MQFLKIEPQTARFDLRHIEDVVDDVEQIAAAVHDIAAIFVIFLRAQLAEHSRFHDLGKADDGVQRRAQFVAHIGEEFGLGAVGVLGAGLLFGIFLREFGELLRLDFQRLLRMRRSTMVAICRFSLSINRSS
jgi:hypothetical protein